MNFNVLQKKALYAEEPKILCLASAASGKSRVLTERVKYLIEEKNIDPSDIVAISFTNMAAEEVRKRIGSAANGAFIGTIHSYANKICLANNVDTYSNINNGDFDKILEKAIKISYNKYPRIRHLLIDECQDISPLEYQFISRIPSDNVFYTGDDRQQIYGFKGCTDKFLKNMYINNQYKKYFLVDNYRNAPNIIEFAERFLESAYVLSRDSNPIKTKTGVIEECLFMEALEALEEHRKLNDWGDWFILTRTNAELIEVQKQLKENEIPYVTFKQGDLNSTQLEELMNSNKVKVLTIHSAKGLERPYVIVIGAKTYNEEERKIAYVAATRAESELYWCPTIVSKRKKSKSGVVKF